jgi:hypothetical protein
VRARVTVRTAAAIRLQRIQEFQQVTWPWSRPVVPFALWKSSSIFHLVQMMWTRPGEADGRGGVAAVEGEFTGVAVAADDQIGVLGGGCLVGDHVDQGPVVVPVTLEAVAGAHPHPRLLRDAAGEFGGAQAAGPGGGAVVGLHGQGVVDAQGAGGSAQLAPAVYLVPGEPARRDAQGPGAGEHGGGKLRFGGELHRVRHVPQQTAFLVRGPVGRQVQLPVDQRMAAGGGVGQVDGDLAQTDPAQSAGVLVGRADAVRGRLRPRSRPPPTPLSLW